MSSPPKESPVRRAEPDTRPREDRPDTDRGDDDLDRLRKLREELEPLKAPGTKGRGDEVAESEPLPSLAHARSKGKIRIRLKSYETSVVEAVAHEIVQTAKRTGASVSGPVPLPTEKNVYCVIRSPFKDKDSREHFEIRTHKRLIDIHEPTLDTINSLKRLSNLPAGLDIEIRLG